MSTVKPHASLPVEVIDYLDSHPDIFAKHPDLLSGLDFPHATGKNITSLIEYQVIRLRQELDKLRHAISSMEYDSAQHKKLTSNIHALALKLLVSQTPQDLYHILQRELKTYYSADSVLLLIFTGVKNMDNHTGLKFHNSSSKLRFMFLELFHRSQPLCGSLQEEHMQALFGGNSETIISTVLLPCAGDGWQELLVLGSQTENRYCHGPELEFLSFINNIICRKISSWFPG
jgi:uncharacterized protein YigA (DUF484 family)